MLERDLTPEEIEAELEDWVAECVDTPLDYVLGAFDWGHGDLEDETGPDEWQTEILTLLGSKCLTISEALLIAVSSGHGVGKSALAAWIILWAMSTRPDLNGVVTANTKSQLDGKTWRELALWHKRAINQHWFKWTATKFYHLSAADTWFVQAVAWSKNKPEAFAGLHAEHVLMLFDEASAIDDEIWETAEGALTTPGAIWVCFGNPTRPNGRFRECWGKFRHRWLTRKVDSRSAKKADRRQIQKWIDDYGEDSDFVRIRVKGEPPRASSTQFIGSDLVEAAQTRLEPEQPVLTPVVIGVDVARFGDDQSIILVRRGDFVEPLRSFRGIDTVKLAGFVAETIEQVNPDAVFVDGGGVGAGVVDQLKALKYKIIEVQAGSSAQDEKVYFNLRAEMWGRMKDWLKNRGRLPSDQELADDLTGIEYGFSDKLQIQLEKKDDMKSRGLASPDKGDALAMTFARRIASKEVQRVTGKQLPTHANVGYDQAKRWRRQRQSRK